MRATEPRRWMNRRPSLLRAVLFTSTLVLGVLIGLLGMHVLSTGTAHHAAVTAGAHITHHDSGTHDATPVTAQPGAAAPCSDGDGCAGDMDAMGFMACVLALLAAAIVLTIRPGPGFLLPRTAIVPPATYPVVRAPVRPPNLTVLSISRT